MSSGRDRKKKQFRSSIKIVRVARRRLYAFALCSIFFHMFFYLSMAGAMISSMPRFRYYASFPLHSTNVVLNSVAECCNGNEVIQKVNLGIKSIAIIVYSFYAYVVLGELNLPIRRACGSRMTLLGVLFIFSYLYIKSGRWKLKKLSR